MYAQLFEELEREALPCDVLAMACVSSAWARAFVQSVDLDKVWRNFLIYYQSTHAHESESELRRRASILSRAMYAVSFALGDRSQEITLASMLGKNPDYFF